MSDFDTVLERLLVDTGFRSALAADPAVALSGYHLSTEEVALLCSQVDAGAGGERTVELRTSKASLFGMLAPLGEVAQHLGQGTTGVPQGGIEPPPGSGFTQGGAPLGDGQEAGFGTARIGESMHQFGAVQGTAGGQLAPTGGAAFGEIAEPVHGSLGAGDHTPVGYHPHIDADGDGHWDRYTAVQH